MRPTRGLVSRSGVIPNSQTQDEVGPIARTVTDAALVLDVMAGYDPADPITAFGRGHQPASFTHLLRADALEGARIGVMTNLFGKEERHREVNKAMDGVIARMEGQGATSVRFELPEYDRLLPVIATDTHEARTVMERYFAAPPANSPIKSFGALLAAKTSAVQKAVGAQRHAVQWHRLSGGHLSSGVLRGHRHGTPGRSNRGRAARPRLHRRQTSLVRLRAGTDGQPPQITTEHACPAGRTVTPVNIDRRST